MDFHETWMEDVSQPRIDSVNFWIKGHIQNFFFSLCSRLRDRWWRFSVIQVIVNLGPCFSFLKIQLLGLTNNPLVALMTLKLRTHTCLYVYLGAWHLWMSLTFRVIQVDQVWYWIRLDWIKGEWWALAEVSTHYKHVINWYKAFKLATLNDKEMRNGFRT